MKLVEVHQQVKFAIAIIAPWLAVVPGGRARAAGAVPLMAAAWLLTFPPLYTQGWNLALGMTWLFGLTLAGLGLASLRHPPEASPPLGVGFRLALGLTGAGLGWLLWRTEWL